MLVCLKSSASEFLRSRASLVFDLISLTRRHPWWSDACYTYWEYQHLPSTLQNDLSRHLRVLFSLYWKAFVNLLRLMFYASFIVLVYTLKRYKMVKVSLKFLDLQFDLHISFDYVLPVSVLSTQNHPQCHWEGPHVISEILLRATDTHSAKSGTNHAGKKDITTVARPIARTECILVPGSSRGHLGISKT